MTDLKFLIEDFTISYTTTSSSAFSLMFHVSTNQHWVLKVNAHLLRSLIPFISGEFTFRRARKSQLTRPRLLLGPWKARLKHYPVHILKGSSTTSKRKYFWPATSFAMGGSLKESTIPALQCRLCLVQDSIEFGRQITILLDCFWDPLKSS